MSAVGRTDLRAAAFVGVATIALHPQLVLGMPWRFGHDCLEYSVPHAIFFFRELAAGQLPLWNPFHDGGAPFLAQPPWMGPFYPAVLLFLLPMARALDLGFLLHIVSFAVGSYALARVRGVGRAASMLAALAVGAGTPLSDLARLGYLPEAVALSYLPWVLLCLDRGIRRETSAPRAIAGAGLCLGLMHLGGHLVASGVVLFAAGLYAVGMALGAKAGDEPPRYEAVARAVLLLIASELLGVALAAIQLLPLVAAGRESILSEGREVSGEYDYLTQLWRLGNFLFARFDPAGKGHLFIGVALLPFVALASRRRARAGRGNAELWVLLGGALLLSVGDATPLWRVLRALPPFRIFSYFYFFLVPAALALALLSAHGIHAWLERPVGAPPPPAVGLVIAALPIVACLTLWASGSGDARTLVRPHLVASLPWTFMGICGSGLSLLWPRTARCVLSAALAIELVHFVAVNRVAAGEPFVVESYFDGAELAPSLPAPGTGRVLHAERTHYAREWALRRNGGMVLSYEDLGRDSKLPLARVAMLTDRLRSMDVDWVRALAASKTLPEGDRARLDLGNGSADVRVLDLLGATTLVTDLPVEGDAFRIPFAGLVGRRAADSTVRVWERAKPAARVWLASSWSLASSADAAAAVALDLSVDPFSVPVVEGLDAPPAPHDGSAATSSSTSRVTRSWAPGFVELDTYAEQSSLLVIGEVAARGWRVTIDGEPARTGIANLVSLATVVPAGIHHVIARYRPAEFAVGGFVSACAWLGLAFVGLRWSKLARN